MNAPGVTELSRAKVARSLSIPLVDGLGEVRVERLEDGTVRFTDKAADLPPYTLEFSRDEWAAVVAVITEGMA
jgi:hypothetical protein